MPSLCLVPIYTSDRLAMLASLGTCLERTFGLPAEIHPPWFDPEVPFDPSRGQYNSTIYLRQLLQGPGGEIARILGIAGVDLFIPVLTHVFGEAQLDGRVAIVSLHRLRNEAYGLPADDKLLFDRLEKEAVHELGHTFGLLHCQDHSCVMRSSTYVEEIDLKNAGFCPPCQERLRGRIP